jgi:DNA segregation ATPase FtsK/SpoIIIE, S-DNA-T family
MSQDETTNALIGLLREGTSSRTTQEERAKFGIRPTPEDLQERIDGDLCMIEESAEKNYRNIARNEDEKNQIDATEAGALNLYSTERTQIDTILKREMDKVRALEVAYEAKEDELTKTKITFDSFKKFIFGPASFIFVGIFIASKLLDNTTLFSGLVAFCVIAPLLAYTLAVDCVRASRARRRLSSEIQAERVVASNQREHAEEVANRAHAIAREKIEQKVAAFENGRQAILSKANQLARERELTEQRFKDFLQSSRRAALGAHDNGGAALAAWGTDFTNAWTPTVKKDENLRIGAFARHSISNHQMFRLERNEPLLYLPATVRFPGDAGIILQFRDAASRSASLSLLRGLALRLIATVPPGKLRITMLDPVGLGQNFSNLLKLGSASEELINSRPWSEPPHIENQLSKLTADIENIVQKYLLSDYKNLDEYNEAAGRTAEPYRLLLVADFPVNFSEAATRRLISIAENGPRCGVFPIVLFDQTKPLPYGIDADEIVRRFVPLKAGPGDQVAPRDLFPKGWTLQLDSEPANEIYDQIISVVGPLAAEGMKVSVPYRDLLRHAGVSAPEQCWPAERSTKDSLVVPLGPRDAGRYQELVLGKGVLHSALVVGMPGSGKSNLLHALITSTALLYPPGEVELYLIDLKPGGIEFERYAQIGLPHARVIAVDSEREFGLAVLRALDNEMEQRGNRCRSHGNNLSTFRSNTGELMPRIVLVIDEFLVLFETNDRIASEAINIIGRLVRLGRAFGIHLILASQTLRGSESLPKSLIDLISIRIVLQCSDADAKAALADDNHAAALLSRPGEGIFNDKIGAIEGNSRFQVAAMGDDTEHRALLNEYIEPLSRRLGRDARRPVVFRGDEPAQLSACQPLLRLLSENSWPARRPYSDIWLGEPLSLDQPTSLRIMRQSGSHGLFIVRDEDQGASLLHASLLALAAQNAPGDARFFVVDMTNADRPWRARTRALAMALPHKPYVTETSRGLHGVLEELGRLVERRSKTEDQSGESIFLMLMGIQKMRTLREDDVATYAAPGIAGVGDADSSDGSLPGPSANERLTTILRDGPEVGVHVLAWGDALAGVMRVMDRRMIGSMSLRVAGPMSEQDSQNFIDVPAAARIQRPHRLIRLDDNDPGSLGLFRPYLVASSEWIEDAASLLASRSP